MVVRGQCTRLHTTKAYGGDFEHANEQTACARRPPTEMCASCKNNSPWDVRTSWSLEESEHLLLRLVSLDLVLAVLHLVYRVVLVQQNL